LKPVAGGWLDLLDRRVDRAAGAGVEQEGQRKDGQRCKARRNHDGYTRTIVSSSARSRPIVQLPVCTGESG
jgi:hypothetical protein